MADDPVNTPTTSSPNPVQGLPYLPQCFLLRTCARLLRLPSRAIVTALLYLHRYHRSVTPEWLDANEPETTIVAACIFLASKVEEVSLSNNHLLNAVRIVSSLASGSPPASEPTAPNSPPFSLHAWDSVSQDHALLAAKLDSCTVLVGQEYYDAKAALLLMEQKLLRLMRFQLLVEQPYAHLFHVLDTLHLSLPAVEAAVSIMNDLATFSTCLLDAPPLHLAAAVVHVTTHLLGSEPFLPAPNRNSSHRTPPHAPPQPRPISWYQALGVPHADIEALGHRILNTLEQAQAYTYTSRTA